MAWFTLARRREKRELRELLTVMRVAMHGDTEIMKKLTRELEED